MSWIYKRHIAFKLSEVIIPNIFEYIEVDTEKTDETFNSKNLSFEIHNNDKLNIIEFIENCIERVKPLSKSKTKGNKKKKLNNGKESQKHDSQLSILIPRLSKELIQWYFKTLLTLNQIPINTNIKVFKFGKNLDEWCKELKDKFPINRFLQSVVATGIYLNFTLSKAEFLKLQLYTIPYVLSKSEEFMTNQKRIVDVNAKKLDNTKINQFKNIALYFTPVKLSQILSSSVSSNIGTSIESMTNHVKSLILSNFVAKLYLSNSDIINYLKNDAMKSFESVINSSIFITRYIEDCNSLAKIIYMSEKCNYKLSNIIKEYNHRSDKEQAIIDEIYHLIIEADKEIQQENNTITLKKIKEIETYLENNSYFLFDQSSTEKKDSKDENIKFIIKTIRLLLSNRYIKGVQRILSKNTNKNEKSLEIYNEFICNNSKNSILVDTNKAFNGFSLKSSQCNNLLLYWIFGYMYDQKILKKEKGENILLDVIDKDNSIVEKGKLVIHFIKECSNNIYIDLESIDFSHNKTQKFIPIIKNIKQGRIYLKNCKKEIDNEGNEIVSNEEISELYSDLVLIINRIFAVTKQETINKVIFVNNINKEHHYMQLISLLEWIQYCCEKEGNDSNTSNIKILNCNDKNSTIIKANIGTEWEIVTHGRVDNLWDFSTLDSLNLTSNKVTLDLNYLINASKVEMSEVIESNIEKYRDMEKELQNENQNDDEFTCVKSVDDIIEVSGVSSIVLQNLQFRRMKNYKYEWISTNNEDEDSFGDFDDFSNNKKSNVGLYLQYIYAKICGILRNCDYNIKQKEFLKSLNEIKIEEKNSLFLKNQDIFESIEEITKTHINDKFNSILDFDELVRVTPEVFPFIWFLDDYIYNIYPSVYQKIEPSLILDALNHISHSISSASSNLRVKGLGKSRLSNEIKALSGRKRTRGNEQDNDKNDQYWEVLANTRLILFSYVRKILYHGLSILGVQPLDRM